MLVSKTWNFLPFEVKSKAKLINTIIKLNYRFNYLEFDPEVRREKSDKHMLIIESMIFLLINFFKEDSMSSLCRRIIPMTLEAGIRINSAFLSASRKILSKVGLTNAKINWNVTFLLEKQLSNFTYIRHSSSQFPSIQGIMTLSEVEFEINSFSTAKKIQFLKEAIFVNSLLFKRTFH